MSGAQEKIQTVPNAPFKEFFESELKEVPAPAQKLLEEYSKIPSDQVLNHIRAVVRFFSQSSIYTFELDH